MISEYASTEASDQALATIGIGLYRAESRIRTSAIQCRSLHGKFTNLVNPIIFRIRLFVLAG